jgi:hypothetical protein
MFQVGHASRMANHPVDGEVETQSADEDVL